MVNTSPAKQRRPSRGLSGLTPTHQRIGSRSSLGFEPQGGREGEEEDEKEGMQELSAQPHSHTQRRNLSSHLERLGGETLDLGGTVLPSLPLSLLSSRQDADDLASSRITSRPASGATTGRTLGAGGDMEGYTSRLERNAFGLGGR